MHGDRLAGLTGSEVLRKSGPVLPLPVDWLYLVCVNPYQRKIAAIVDKLLEWYPKNARDLPWRREPYRNDPYCVYVSEVMLQQTQVKTVIPYWKRWMREVPTIQALAKAPPTMLHKLWEGLGYYTRVRNMQEAAQVISSQHAGQFPQEFANVLELPGIGRYTAGAICSIAFNQPYPVLDGNVIRVLTRSFGIKGNPREAPINRALWRLAEDLVGNAFARQPPATSVKARAGPPSRKEKKLSAAGNLNQALMELGALVCTARQPRCHVCPLARSCVARRECRIEDYPATSPRPRATQRRFVAFVVERGGRLLLRQRPAGVVNAFLWEFPNFELTGANGKMNKTARRRFERLPNLLWFCSIKHSITRFRITLDVFRAALRNGTPPPPFERTRWLTRAELEQLPFTGAHKRILLKLHASEPSIQPS